MQMLTNQAFRQSQIKMEDENDFMNIAKYACCALKYFSVYKKFEQLYLSIDEKLRFDNIIEQTQKIILTNYGLVNDILSSETIIHIPILPIQFIMPFRVCILKLILTAYYYSNKAVVLKNIGWMNLVAGIIPELQNDEKEK
ncbi:6774_t:CDS:2, partial [Gigaspora margarita]